MHSGNDGGAILSSVKVVKLLFSVKIEHNVALRHLSPHIYVIISSLQGDYVTAASTWT